MINVLRQHKGVASLVFANIGVAVSLLVGAVQFLSTYEQTQADVMYLHEAMDQVVRHDQLDGLHVRLDETARSLGERLDGVTADATWSAERLTVLETQRDEGRSKEFELDAAQQDIQLLRERLAEFDTRFQNLDQSSYDVEDLRQRIADVKVVISRLETRADRSDEDRWKLDDLDSRLDRLDDFVVRWDEQSSMIMSEHQQFSVIIKEVWEAIDARGTVPAGANRSYGYD
jgi:chromosome segregation ATPase